MFMFWTSYRFGFIFIQILTSINGQSTTASYLQGETYLDQLKYPRSKYYYLFAPRSQVRDLIEPAETETLLEDRGYDHYEGYQAQWPSDSHKVIHQQPIHVHHNVQGQHKEKNEHSYLLPILLLALLPLLLGALLVLPLLFSFLTQVLQLLALMQQTLQNLQNNGTGKRRKRSDYHINPIILDTISTLVENFISSQQKYARVD